MTLSLSIVVPAYNEGARLGRSLRAIVTYLNEYAPEAEVIVVDDGSTDKTAATARDELSDSKNLRTSVISYQSNLGKGRAVRLGLLASRGEIALFTDADLSTPITETPKLVDPILRGECTNRGAANRVVASSTWLCGWRLAFLFGTRNVASKLSA
jgi:glycosyltransferase involved in cell wall biosynthesis